MKMKKIDIISEFRNTQIIKALLWKINKECDRPINIMEVCGGHTHTIMKYGINQTLPSYINFIHGPGCPVCIMPKERIDHAITLADEENSILVTLGDMIKVKGQKLHLQTRKLEGKNIKVIYSPFDVLKIAKENPDKNVIYFAIGFETTTPMTASVIEFAIREKVKNLFFHINHVLVIPPIKAILESGEARIDAFIAPSHVSVITGAKIYEDIAKTYKTPVVVTGFEPVDILDAILRIIRQLKDKKSDVEIQYSRVVSWEGNKKAQELIDRYFELREKFRWRGIGDIPYSALKLKPDFRYLDAEYIFKDKLDKILPSEDHTLCICGDILKGVAKPIQCKLFGKICNPSNPVGSCMVSSEGACSAYYRYSYTGENGWI